MVGCFAFVHPKRSFGFFSACLSYLGCREWQPTSPASSPRSSARIIGRQYPLIGHLDGPWTIIPPSSWLVLARYFSGPTVLPSTYNRCLDVTPRARRSSATDSHRRRAQNFPSLLTLPFSFMYIYSRFFPYILASYFN